MRGSITKLIKGDAYIYKVIGYDFANGKPLLTKKPYSHSKYEGGYGTCCLSGEIYAINEWYNDPEYNMETGKLERNPKFFRVSRNTGNIVTVSKNMVCRMAMIMFHKISGRGDGTFPRLFEFYRYAQYMENIKRLQQRQVEK